MTNFTFLSGPDWGWRRYINADKLIRGELHLCQEPGCMRPAIACEVPWVIGDPLGKEPDYEWYCPVHAHKNGYCYMCGHFWAGVEMFDFNRSGLCENCQSEVEEDYDEEMQDLYFEAFGR